MSDTVSALPLCSATPQFRLRSGMPMPMSDANPMRLAGWSALEQTQDVRIVDRGFIVDHGYDATKFATRSGPPSCSPPV